MRKFVKIVFVFFVCLLMGCDFIPDSGTPSTKNDEVVISFYDGNTLIKKINGKKGDDFPNEVYEKEGFNFVGWDMNNDGNPDQMPIAVTSDVTLRAVLVKKAEYQCIFAYNGEAVSELIVEKGTKVESYDLELPTENEYTFTMETAADTLLALMVQEELDIALVPANVASVLFNKTIIFLPAVIFIIEKSFSSNGMDESIIYNNKSASLE